MWLLGFLTGGLVGWLLMRLAVPALVTDSVEGEAG